MWSGSLVAGVPAGTMGPVSTSSPARDAQRRGPGGTVLQAVLERITYANEETGYTIARVATDQSGSDLVTVVGAPPSCWPRRRSRCRRCCSPWAI
jgi:exodeoxyribonuclease V alpha subunit